MDWAPEVKRISQELLGNSRDQLNQDDEEDGENFEENANGDDEGHELAEYLWDAFHYVGKIDKKAVVQKMRRSQRGYDVKLAGGYVELGNGVSGGGPTYMLIYMRKKQKYPNDISNRETMPANIKHYLGVDDMDKRDFFDEGYTAFEKGIAKDSNPINQEEFPEDWEEWNDGWDRGESDEEQRMNEYCCGGADWPEYDFDTQFEYEGKTWSAQISFEWVDNSEAYYRSEPAHPQKIYVKLFSQDGEEESEIDIEVEDEEIQKRTIELIQEYMDEN